MKICRFLIGGKETYGFVKDGHIATKEEIITKTGIPIPLSIKEFLFDGWYKEVISQNPKLDYSVKLSDAKILDEAKPYTDQGKDAPQEIIDRYTKADDRLTALQKEQNKLGKAVPDAPFKKNWQELAMKRAMQMAAEGGYDRVAFTTGKQQAERYNLAKYVDRIIYDTDTKTLRAFDKNNQKVKKTRTSSTVSERHVPNAGSILQSFWVRCRSVFPNITDRKFMESELRFVLYCGILFWFIYLLYETFK